MKTAVARRQVLPFGSEPDSILNFAWQYFDLLTTISKSSRDETQLAEIFGPFTSNNLYILKVRGLVETFGMKRVYELTNRGQYVLKRLRESK